MKEMNQKDLSEKTMTERFFEGLRDQLVARHGDDFAAPYLSLKWRMAEYQQKGWDL
jgi:hypothetical protein